MKHSTTDRPFVCLNELNDGLSRFVNDIFCDTAAAAIQPSLTIYEHDDRFVIESDLPGVALDDISLEVDDGVLEISGERRAPELPEGSVVRHDERSWKPFQRRIRLDKSVDITAIEADYQDGILIITAPRLPETRPHKVAIRRVTN